MASGAAKSRNTGDRGVRGSGGAFRFEPPLFPFILELRKTPERLDLAQRKEFVEVARTVRDEAREKAASGRPLAVSERTRPTQHHWKQFVNSIQAGSTSTRPHVSVGSRTINWMLSFEFGSYRYRHHPWLGNGKNAGYFLFPTVRERREEVLDKMLGIVNRYYEQLYPDRSLAA